MLKTPRRRAPGAGPGTREAAAGDRGGAAEASERGSAVEAADVTGLGDQGRCEQRADAEQLFEWIAVLVHECGDLGVEVGDAVVEVFDVAGEFADAASGDPLGERRPALDPLEAVDHLLAVVVSDP